jgi:putative PIN family toxin of toxin-antitoxin system
VKIVLDTDAIVAAMRSPDGASAAVLGLARSGSIALLVSVPLALEYEAVCMQADHRIATGLTAREASIFVEAVIAMSEPVQIDFLWRPQLRDASDEMVLETAINGRADAIVTFNSRDFGNAPELFGIEVWVPREAIRRLRK